LFPSKFLLFKILIDNDDKLDEKIGSHPKGKGSSRISKLVLTASGAENSGLNTNTRNFRETGPYFAEDRPSHQSKSESPSMKKKGKR
jgi:hypothetical protein